MEEQDDAVQTDLSTESCSIHGYYSTTQDLKMGHAVYEDKNGKEYRFTEVRHRLSTPSYPDARLLKKFNYGDLKFIRRHFVPETNAVLDMPDPFTGVFVSDPLTHVFDFKDTPLDANWSYSYNDLELNCSSHKNPHYCPRPWK